MVEGSQGADPPAEHPSKQKGEDEDQQAQKEGEGDLVRGQEGSQPNQGVKLQEYPNRIADFVQSPVARQNE